ncbi:MAG: hypothetical protein AM325_016370 [Candidatus Thorarchaeota archaeon SMTZ1-45]
MKKKTLILLMFSLALLFSGASAFDGYCNETAGENSTNSPDCAIVINQIADLRNATLDNNYVKVKGVNIIDDAVCDMSKEFWARLGSSIASIILMDNSTDEVVYVSNDWFEFYPDISTCFTDNELIEITGFLEMPYPDVTIEESWLNLGYISNITILGTSDWDIQPTIFPDYLDNLPSTPDTYMTAKQKLYSDEIGGYYHYEQVNSTTEKRTELITNTTIYRALNETRANKTDYDFYWLFIWLPTTQYIDYTKILSKNPIPASLWNFTGEITTIASGNGFNQTISGIGNVYGMSYFTEINVVGDGVCSSLESDNPYEWNYSPDCRLGGMTGYAVAVGTQQMQSLVIIGGALMLLGAIVSFLAFDFTLASILTLTLSIISGIAILIALIPYILTP